MENKAIELFNEALKKLQDANDELSRPDEDVVSYLVCKNSQYAVENFLLAYLLNRGIDPQDYRNINSLYERCVAINPALKSMNLSDFTCKSYASSSRFCSGTDKVGKCYKVAENLGAFVKGQMFV